MKKKHAKYTPGIMIWHVELRFSESGLCYQSFYFLFQRRAEKFMNYLMEHEADSLEGMTMTYGGEQLWFW